MTKTLRNNWKLSATLLFLASCAIYGSFKLLDGPAKNSTNDSTVEDLDRLKALPYVHWTKKQADSQMKGVTKYDPDRASPGYNLFTNDMTQIYLMDLEGRIVHTWNVPGNKKQCEYARMLENGDLLVICLLQSLVKLDWDSNLLWDRKLHIHHDIDVLQDRTILALVQERPVRYNSYNVLFDSIIRLSPQGKIQDRWSTFMQHEKLKRFHPPSALDRPPDSKRPGNFDYYHLNTIQSLPDTPLGKRDKRFQRGNLLICLRNVNLIAILDRDSKEVVWAWGSEILDFPHMPTMLSSGNILIFDNGMRRKYSRVLEINPATKRIVWEYKANPLKKFFSALQGSSQRLPNGNTLISESSQGHVFEVNRVGELEWEFWNPVMKEGKRKTIYRFMRVPEEHVRSLIARASIKGPRN